MKYKIFCGAKETMEKIAFRHARGLNPKTMKWQVIDKTAKYEIVSGKGIIFWLTSNLNLDKIAKQKSLII